MLIQTRALGVPCRCDAAAPAGGIVLNGVPSSEAPLIMRFTTAGVVIFAVFGACADPQAATEPGPSQFVAHVQDVPCGARAVPPDPARYETGGTVQRPA